MDKNIGNKFYYYDKLKKNLIEFICAMLTVVIALITIPKLDFINKSDIMVKLFIGLIVIIVMVIAHFISKCTCYHEGIFKMQNNKAVIYMNSKTYEISKDEVKKVKFEYSPGFRIKPPYYYFKVKYGNKKCTIILDGSEYNYGRDIEKINLYRLYSFLNNNEKHK